MTLRRIFQERYAEAELTGESSCQLGGGAGIRVRWEGARRQVILSRAGAPVGATETQTFTGIGQIPPGAVGVCWLPRAGLYRVSYSWEVEAPPATLFDEVDDAPPARLPDARLPDWL